MASIGIMSMQRIFNYGSSLQGYALRRLLEEASGGASVSFIDYAPGDPLIKDSSEASTRLGRVTAKVREYGDVKADLGDKIRFFNHKRRYGTKYYSSVGIQPEKNHQTDVDLQIIGSDEVFNCVQSNVNVGFSPDLFGLGSEARSLASYAASFGNTTLKKIEDAGVRDEVTRGLGRFSAISVRDENSATIVAELLGTEAPPVHLDPTLVYDLMGNDPNIPKERLRNDKYMIVYGYSGRFTANENESIRQYANKHGLNVFAFGGLQESADQFVDCSPFELLAYFRDAEAIVTDTFHGTIFSLINEVPFATIIRRSAVHGYGNEEKLSYLLRRLELDGRALQSPGELEQLLQEPIDFSQVRRVRGTEAPRTRGYLATLSQKAGLGGAA